MNEQSLSRRRTICVPLDCVAMQDLDFDCASETQILELKLTHLEFKKLWDIGVFAAINDSCSSLIDDFEDDSILGIENLYNCLKAVKLVTNRDGVQDLMSQLEDLVQEAINRKTGIYFFL
ncbi:hypothetical protein [Leptolyngbya sp. ST-U4]|uniref:hypothetical protein n=1 Tax=Leptolyngbya sp. ST-U4 TaxID=2933912 RepID=UPI003296FA03